jgi:hypothetical protein
VVIFKDLQCKEWDVSEGNELDQVKGESEEEQPVDLAKQRNGLREEKVEKATPGHEVRACL